MKRYAAIFLALVLTVTAIMPVSALAGDTPAGRDPVRIHSAEEFLGFADSCTETDWSEGRTVYLEKDIDLSGTAFSSVPYFAGTFKGQKHRITGLNIDNDGSRQGLFRIIAEGASVSDLTVCGTVTPGGSGVAVGGIAGVNGGTISGCSFEGSVSGVEKVGGIAGENTATGTIRSCSASGSIRGEHMAGGIAGFSEGVISVCTGKTAVNTVYFVPEGETHFDISAISEEDFLDITDIGGICGSNTGTVLACTNSGSVGYNLVGYNVGGVCGSSRGFVSGCTSSGAVMGRKDVGGIVGQLIPNISLDFGPGVLDNISGAISSLNASISYVENTVSGNRRDLDKELDNTKQYVTELGSEIKNLAEQQAAAGSGITVDPETGAVSYVPVAAPDTTELIRIISALYGQYDTLVKLAGDSAKETAGSLLNLSGQISSIMSSLSSAFSVGTIFEQVNLSSGKAYEQDTGAVAGCVSRGTVSAESCAGGIAGSMSYELEFDAEDSLQLDNALSRVTEYVFCVIRDCESYGTTETKADCAGGICGKLSVGAVTGCIGGGSVISRTGNYVGGITGDCAGDISNCCARTVLSGGSYVGGITGFGGNLSDCKVYAAFEAYDEYAGSVSGWTDGEVSGIFYVSSRPAGIDGISWSESMQSLSYDEFLKLENVPDVFREITVTFIGPDGSVVDSVSLGFGDAVENLPEIENDGIRYWKWDSENLGAVYYSIEVHGAWYNPATTLTTGEDLPLLLVEGTFYEGQELNVIDCAPDGVEDAAVAKTVTVSGYTGVLTVRLFSEKDGTVYVLRSDGNYEAVSGTKDGRYIVFRMENGSSFAFVEAKTIEGGEKHLLASAVVALLLMILVFLLIKRRKIKKASLNGEDRKTAPENKK